MITISIPLLFVFTFLAGLLAIAIKTGVDMFFDSQEPHALGDDKHRIRTLQESVNNLIAMAEEKDREIERQANLIHSRELENFRLKIVLDKMSDGFEMCVDRLQETNEFLKTLLPEE